MLSLVAKLQSRLAGVRDDESGQDAFEYLLVIGVVMVVAVGAVAAGFKPGTFVSDIMTAVENAVKGAL